MYSKKVRHGIISVFEEEQDIWGAVFTPDDTSSNSVIFWYDQTCDAVQGYVEENWDRLYEMQTAFVTDEKRDADATWERLAPAEPKNLGAVVEFTTKHGETKTVVLAFGDDSLPFYDGYCMETFAWKDILAVDANPRVLHEGWDGK